MMRFLRGFALGAVVGLGFAGVAVCAQSGAAQSGLANDALTILKVDPPNWFAALPKPMLLVRGEGFTGAQFSLSDPALHIESSAMSANGHWAQLWLAASPAQAETVQLAVRRGARHAEIAYTFAAARASGDGAAGVSTRDVMYLIMTDRFADGDRRNDGARGDATATSADAMSQRALTRGWHGGDLRGVEQHLDYLQQLGVTTVWPTPVYQNHGPEAYHGYHATDYYAVDEHYGTLADLQSLVAALHKRGMKLVLDTVPNHVGPFHPWVTDAPMPDWFHGTLKHHIAAKYDFSFLVDPHSAASDRTPILDGWFANNLPDMNTENPAVAQYLRQNAVWWIEETGADGLRIDTFPYVNRAFWREYHAMLRAVFPRVTEVGEVLRPEPAITSFFAGGKARTAADGTIDTGLYTPFDFPFYFALKDSLTGKKPMTALADVFAADPLYPHPERLVTLIDNHDEKRFVSEDGSGVARLRMAFALLATVRGTPQLYYGDELAMQGKDDPDDRRDFPGGFADDPADAFEAAGRTPAQESMHRWVAELFAIRAHAAALQEGAQQTVFADASVFGFTRTAAGSGDCTASPEADRYLIVANVAAAAREIVLDTDASHLKGCRHFSVVAGDDSTASATARDVTLRLQPEAVVVFRVRR